MSGILPEIHKVVSGAVSSSSAGALTVIAAPDVGRLCITALQLGRNDSGIGALTVTLNDLAKTPFVLPNGISGTSGIGATLPFTFDTPLMWASATAVTVSSTGVATLFASAQGFALE